MKNKIKFIVKVIVIFISSFLFWYLMFGFIGAEFNVWKWFSFNRGIYVIISLITFGKILDELDEE